MSVVNFFWNQHKHLIISDVSKNHDCDVWLIENSNMHLWNNTRFREKNHKKMREAVRDLKMRTAGSKACRIRKINLR